MAEQTTTGSAEDFVACVVKDVFELIMSTWIGVGSAKGSQRYSPEMVKAIAEVAYLRAKGSTDSRVSQLDVEEWAQLHPQTQADLLLALTPYVVEYTRQAVERARNPEPARKRTRELDAHLRQQLPKAAMFR